MSPSLKQDVATYGIGYVLAVLLTGASFTGVYFRLLPRSENFMFVLTLALVQIVVHLRCFLHIKASARANLQLLLFSAAIIMLIVAGTLVILFDERTRMM